MSRILKYEVPHQLAAEVESEVEMPTGSSLLTVHEQRGAICVWVAADERQPLVRRRFSLRWTGSQVDWPSQVHWNALANPSYVGTVFLGDLVWHVFDCGEVGPAGGAG